MSDPKPQQHCYVCDALTGRCGEDSIYLPPLDPNGNDLGPLCEECAEERDPTPPPKGHP